jgi:hypothetical protein
MENGIAVSVLFLLFRSAKSGTKRNTSLQETVSMIRKLFCISQ